MKKALLFSVISLLCISKTNTHWVTSDTCSKSWVGTIYNFFTKPAEEFSADEKKLMEIIEQKTEAPELIAALTKYYSEEGHDWPLQIARVRLSALSNHLALLQKDSGFTLFNEYDHYTELRKLITNALRIIAIGNVPFN